MAKRLLLVEDDEEIRIVLGEFLQSEGYVVDAAADGEEAMKCLRGGTLPSLVLLDLMMPVMDGWAVRREMLKDPVLAQLPVVVISGVTDLQRSTADLKVDACLLKPMDLDVLLATVERLRKP